MQRKEPVLQELTTYVKLDVDTVKTVLMKETKGVSVDYSV